MTFVTALIKRINPQRHPVSAPPHTAVFSINFTRQRSIPLWARRALLYGLLAYVAAQALLWVALLVMAAHGHVQASRLRVQLAPRVPVGALPDLEQAMDALRTRATEHAERLRTIAAEQAEGFPVAGKWAALTKTLPPRMWITQLSGDGKERKLTWTAQYLLDQRRPHIMPVQAWMDALRSDPVFGRSLEHLELVSSTRKLQATAELFTCDIVARWSKDGSHAP